MNVGSDKEISIKQLVKIISRIIGYNGEIYFNTKMPDGTLKKLLNVNKLKKIIKFKKTELKTAIKLTYSDYLKNIS